jgi:hypothetical protein
MVEIGDLDGCDGPMVDAAQVWAKKTRNGVLTLA